MDKRLLHHYHAKFGSYGLWLLMGVAITSLAVFIYASRQNNLTMLALRDKVTHADQQNGDVEAALRDLREHVHGHMNTDLTPTDDSIYPPIQLKYRYERLVEAEQQRVAQENGKIYSDAQADCERRFPQGLSGGGRIPCITEYVTSRGVAQVTVPDELYKFDFVSPRWSPDLAGWSLLLAISASLLFLVKLLLAIWVRHDIKSNY